MFIQLTDATNPKKTVYVAAEAIAAIADSVVTSGATVRLVGVDVQLPVRESPTQILALIAKQQRGPAFNASDICEH